MVTMDERREREIGLAERERQFWNSFRDMLAERARNLDGLAAKATASAAADHADANDAAAKATAAADRIERLRRGEDAPFGREIDVEKIARDTGWTTADIKHARVLAVGVNPCVPHIP
jgi:hypothetical protein